VIFGLEFPPIENLVEWPNIFGPADSWYGFNKIALINLIALVGTTVLFLVAGRKKTLEPATNAPKGSRNLVESAVAFIRDGIIIETIGPAGLRYLPFLASLFFFILITNIFEVIPFFHMPGNARMAGPAVLALLTWAYFIAVGIKHQGLKYFWNSVAPPGVPKALLPLVVPIELLSTFIVRPFSLAVRLFSVLCITLWGASLLLVVLPFSFVMLVGLTGFEIMVAFLQAYIFTILASVYIGSSMHAEH
jgi:F-type H+-transporting ATPase subunit a